MTNLVKSGDYTFAPFQSVMIYAAMNAANPTALKEPMNEEKLAEVEAFMEQINQQTKAFTKETEQSSDVADWPPALDVQQNLSSITAMLEKTKAKTGIEFNKLIGVAPSNSGAFSVNGNHNISIDYAAIKGEMFSHERLADIINHEAAHLHYRDHELNGLAKMAADQMNQLMVIKELHRDNPDLLYKLIQDNYDSIEQFSEQVKGIESAVNKFVEPLFPVMDMNYQAVLHDMYSEHKVEKALDKVSSENSFQQLYASLAPLSLTFPAVTKSQAVKVKEMIDSIDLNSSPQAEATKQHLLATYDSSFNQDQQVAINIAPADKKQIDHIIKEKLLPLSEYPEKLRKFSRETRLAAEFRADDFSVAFSDKPKEAHLCLAEQERIAENIKQNNPEQAAMMIQAEEEDPHPPLSVRVERSKKLGEYVAALRAEKGPEANLLEYLDMSIGAFSLLPTEKKALGGGYTGPG
ncbi:MAG: hypothetical protein P8P30_10060 [Rickettsiales bacterium]|nr:hypothetical protein [Rickettsiales bacterium]